VTKLDPAFVAMARALIAAALASGVLLHRREPFIASNHLPRLALAAGGTVIVGPLLMTFALKRLPASHAAVVFGFLPIAIAFCSTIRGRERPGRMFWLAAAAGLGSILAFAASQGAERPQAGDLLMLSAVAVIAVGHAEGGELAREIGGLRVICWSLVVSAPLLVAPVGVMLVLHPPNAGAGAWVGFGYVSVVSMFLAFIPWYHAMARDGVARVSQLKLAMPVLTLAWSALFLGEQVGSSTILAAACVLMCVTIAQRTTVERAHTGEPLRQDFDETRA
jgi:drug/metabolite transporter (DMT)-like permease